MAINPITLAKPPPAEAPLQDKLNEALVRELLHRSRNAGIALLGTLYLLWLIVAPSTGWLVAALFVALICLAIVRLAGSIWLARRPPGQLRVMRAFAWFTAMSALIGASLAGIVLASYPHLTPLGIALCSVAIIGINSGALVSLAPSPLVYLLYVGSNTAAVLWFAFAHPLAGQEHAFQVMQVVYSSALFLLLRNVHRSFRSTMIVRLELAIRLEQLSDTQTKLVEASRLAGRVDVATEVLHGVGNVLNSVNVSATLVCDITARSRIGNLSKVVAMLLEHRDDFGRFFRDDPRGQKLPSYFAQLADAVERDHGAVRAELQLLTRNIDHIAAIVRAQRLQVQPSNVVETFDVGRLVDDALEATAAERDHQAIELVRELDELPPARLDRYKTLQILLVLLANARDAVMTRQVGARRIVVRALRRTDGELEIAIEDSGCGIDPHLVDRIFGLGFTTKPGSRGLGLHYSACAARQLKGRLTARSAGIGTGAAFSLVLPFAAPE